jgi:hypothetical protein
MAEMITPIISANMTAYSTEVVASSWRQKQIKDLITGLPLLSFSEPRGKLEEKKVGPQTYLRHIKTLGHVLALVKFKPLPSASRASIEEGLAGFECCAAWDDR